jgi:tyrosine-protein phosphatase YwqE
MELLPAYDCHCHILPGLDDGAADLEESLFLCRWLVSKGYLEAVCTSHSTFLYRNTEEGVEKAVAELQRELDARDIPLQLIPSLEYRLVPQTWPRERLLPWKGNHVLVELSLRTPEKMLPLVPEEEIRGLVEAGYQPVLAHPERYLWATPEDYDRWRDAGALFQRNLGSLEGFYGAPAQLRARYLKEKGYCSFLGTDLHNRRYAEAFDGL